MKTIDARHGIKLRTAFSVEPGTTVDVTNVTYSMFQTDVLFQDPDEPPTDMAAFKIVCLTVGQEVLARDIPLNDAISTLIRLVPLRKVAVMIMLKVVLRVENISAKPQPFAVMLAGPLIR